MMINYGLIVLFALIGLVGWCAAIHVWRDVRREREMLQNLYEVVENKLRSVREHTEKAERYHEDAVRLLDDAERIMREVGRSND